MRTQHGGKRAGAGRPKGRASRATIQQKGTLSELARRHTDVALKALVDVATTGESESARVAAANHLLDRGYGRPMQSHEHSGPGGAPISVADLTHATEEQLAALEAVFGPLARSGGDVGGDPGGAGEAGG